MSLVIDATYVLPAAVGASRLSYTSTKQR